MAHVKRRFCKERLTLFGIHWKSQVATVACWHLNQMEKKSQLLSIAVDPRDVPKTSESSELAHPIACEETSKRTVPRSCTRILLGVLEVYQPNYGHLVRKCINCTNMETLFVP